MKIVLDTNIFISGIHWKGPSEKILQLCLYGKFQLITSTPILDELKRILTNFKKPLSPETIKQWKNLIQTQSTLVNPKQKINIVLEDPDDNKFIEAAIEGKAHYIISQDKHLLNIKKYKNIQILHPKEFLKITNENSK